MVTDRQRSVRKAKNGPLRSVPERAHRPPKELTPELTHNRPIEAVGTPEAEPLTEGQSTQGKGKPRATSSRRTFSIAAMRRDLRWAVEAKDIRLCRAVLSAMDERFPPHTDDGRVLARDADVKAARRVVAGLR